MIKTIACIKVFTSD